MANNTEGVVQVRNSPGSMVVSSTTRKVTQPKNVALDEDEFTDVSRTIFHITLILMIFILTISLVPS